MLTLCELTSINDKQYANIGCLLHVLSTSCIPSREVLEDVVVSPSNHLFVVMEDTRIIGMAMVATFCSPTGHKASIEDVVVHPEYQGQHIGRMLMEHCLQWLRDNMHPVKVQLTSRPSRIAANALYGKLGFVRKETNFYTQEL